MTGHPLDDRTGDDRGAMRCSRQVIGPLSATFGLVVLAFGLSAVGAMAFRGSGRAPGSSVPVTACSSLLRPVRFRVPPARRVEAPASLAGRLAVYQFLGLWVLAPRGWHCEGSSGISGTGLWAHPGHAGIDVPQQAVSAWFSTPGVRSGEDACSWFADAAKALRKRGSTCYSQPILPGERQTRVSPRELDFLDPPHVAGLAYPSGGSNPARGFFLFEPAQRDRIGADAFATATCTLPASARPVCSTSLSSIRARFPAEREASRGGGARLSRP